MSEPGSQSADVNFVFICRGNSSSVECNAFLPPRYGPMVRGRGVYAGSYRSSPYLKAPQPPVFGRQEVDPSQVQGAIPGVSQKSAGFRGSARGRGRNMQYIAPHLLESHQQPAPQAQGGNTAPAFRTQHKVWVRPGAVAPAQQVGASSAATSAV